jgi:hypothetical protein
MIISTINDNHKYYGKEFSTRDTPTITILTSMKVSGVKRTYLILLLINIYTSNIEQCSKRILTRYNELIAFGLALWTKSGKIRIGSRIL